MVENDRIRDHLAEAMMNTSDPETKAKLANALNQYDSNVNEKAKNEAKQRLEQDIHEDELIKNRDMAIIDERHFHWQIIKDSIEIGTKIITSVATAIIVVKALKDDKNGEPWFGMKKDLGSAAIRKVM